MLKKGRMRRHADARCCIFIWVPLMIFCDDYVDPELDLTFAIRALLQVFIDGRRERESQHSQTPSDPLDQSDARLLKED